MHDGYLFTLAICGTATASTPAPLLLNTMLAAVPPVKRAALLGEVVTLDTTGRLSDPMLRRIVADMCDADILFFISPIYPVYSAPADRDPAASPSYMLPGRVVALLEHAAPLAEQGQLQGKVAVLIGIDTADTSQDEHASAANSQLDRIVHKHMLLAPLQRFCIAAGIVIAGATVVSNTLSSSDTHEPQLAPDIEQVMIKLAQRAYTQAHEQTPHALS